jgi:hypothetical protein
MLQGIENMANKDLSQNPNKPYWMLTLSLGMALTRAALDWGESALAQLASMESAAVQSQQPVEKNTAPVSTESGR